MPFKPAKTAPATDHGALYFQLFNEIGIIAQLSGNRFQRVLPQGLTVAQFSLLNHCVRLGDGWTPATLSLWRDLESAMAFSYAGLHAEAVNPELADLLCAPATWIDARLMKFAAHLD